MDFRDELYSVLKTKDKAMQELSEKQNREFSAAVEATYEKIKKQLLFDAENGNYTIVNNQKVITSVVTPEQLEWYSWFDVEDISVVTPVERNRQDYDMFIKEMKAAMLEPDINKTITRYKTSSGEIGRVYPRTRIVFSNEYKEAKDRFLSALMALAQNDKIDICYCAYDVFDQKTYPFEQDLDNVSKRNLNLVLALECKYAIANN